jgi:putative PEP-CTERM system TPR-repeat lipoprotein
VLLTLRNRAFCHALWLAAAAVLGAGGCSQETPEGLVSSAAEYLAQGDTAAAVIQLRNALQQQPGNGSARLLLGQALLATRDPVGAQKELRKAMDYGQPADSVLPPLARAMLQLGEADKLVAEFGNRALGSAAQASFQATLGEALLQLGRLQEAADAFSAAIAVDARHVPAQIGFARLLAAEGKLEEANQLIERIIAAHPDQAEAFALQSDLRLAQGDSAGSRHALEQAVRADPAYLPARYALIAMLIDDRRFEAAAEQVEAARAARKGDLQVLYFDGLIALGRNDLPKARDVAQQVLKHAPDHVPTLVLAAAVELQDKQSARAESYLRRALALAPAHSGARRMLVRTHLGANQPAKALEAIQPLVVGKDRSDPRLLMLAGETYLANGDMAQASLYFASASKTESQNVPARTRLGQIALATGNVDAGVKELEAVAATNGSIQADLALIADFMRRNEFDKALAAALALEKKQPQSPLAQQLIGSIYAAKKDPASARKRFDRALELDPGYLPAVVGLAYLDLGEGKPAEARRRLEVLVESNPKNEQALLGLADLQARTGAPATEILATLNRAVSANPQSVNARLALISRYLAGKDAKSALVAAQEAATAIPNDASILGVLAQAQEAAGEPNQAVETLNRAASLRPNPPTALLQLAALHARRGDTSKSIDALKRAQKVAPADPVIARDLVVAYLKSGRTEDAIREAKALQSSTPKLAAGYLLEGDVHATRKKWSEAELAYRNGLKLEPDSSLLASKLHSVLLGGGKSSEADAFGKKWLADHPKDVPVRLYLGERALQARNYRSAAALYESVVAHEPNNVIALNNLAWSAGQIGDPKAIVYAERAARLAPESAVVLDTFGVLLASKGDTAKGLEYLRKATTLAPDRHDIRLNYARVLAKTGQKDAARAELVRLQAVQADFQGKSEIAALLAGL